MAEGEKTTAHEIAELERMLAEKRVAFERQKAAGEIQEVPHEKEILREAVREKIAAIPPVVPFSGTSQPLPSVGAGTEIPSYLSDELRPKVQEFVRMAFEKSLNAAITMAKATQNPALIDAFHDMIVDELYTRLIEEGKLESVS